MCSRCEVGGLPVVVCLRRTSDCTLLTLLASSTWLEGMQVILKGRADTHTETAA
jgi:hypothetical protein